MSEADRLQLAGTRVVKVRVKPGRARVTIQSTIYGVEPRATGTAIIEDGTWRIRDLPADAHVGQALLLRVPSDEMAPFLKPDDLILADQSAYRDAHPQVGEVIVFYPPASAKRSRCAARRPAGQACPVASKGLLKGQKFVKRIVGGPGDRLAIRDGRVIRNGRRVDEPFITPCTVRTDCHFPRTFRLAAGQYYVLGDNRGESDDSRLWGPVTRPSIIGKVRRLGP